MKNKFSYSSCNLLIVFVRSLNSKQILHGDPMIFAPIAPHAVMRSNILHRRLPVPCHQAFEGFALTLPLETVHLLEYAILREETNSTHPSASVMFNSE